MNAASREIQFLYSLQLSGIKMGLRNIRRLMSFLDHPENRFPCVHVAGTNGKGSTSALIAAVLTASGYRTGLYTSPHLVDFSERIRIDGVPISQSDLTRYTSILARAIRKEGATFFEATTAIAFRYFADHGVDIAVIETGLGGRFDSTNVVTPLISIITNIGLEHTEWLGTTHARIAVEKGGIIKRNVPCLTAVTNPSALRTLNRIAKSRKAKLWIAPRCASYATGEEAITGSSLALSTSSRMEYRLFLPLAGGHQNENLRLAVLCLEYLKGHCGFIRIRRQSMAAGVKNVRKLTGLRGRLEILRRSPLIIADVAHNPDGVRALARSLKKLIARPMVTLFGVLKDKDHLKMSADLASISRLIVTVTPRSDRALDSDKLLLNFHKLGKASVRAHSVNSGLDFALKEARRGEPLLIVGSHYVVGEAVQALAEGVKT